MVIAVPINHSLSSKPNGVLKLIDLKDENFIFYQQVNGSGIKENLLKECQRVGFEPKSIEIVYRIIGAIHLVASGLGIAIVPKSMQSIQPDSVSYKTFDINHTLTVPLSIAYRENASKLTVKRFLSLSDAFTKEWSKKH